jgi:hypothetical protein
MVDSVTEGLQSRLENELKLIGEDIRKLSAQVDQYSHTSHERGTKDLREVKVWYPTSSLLFYKPLRAASVYCTFAGFTGDEGGSE